MGLTGFDDGADGISVAFGASVCFFDESSEAAKGFTSTMIYSEAVELVHQVSAKTP
jgi:hypothetical protein